MNIDRLLSIAERVIELFRPKYYNRITWVVVSAGIIMMSSPLWERIAAAFLKIYFDFSITDESDVLFGLLLVITGLFYHLLALYGLELINQLKKNFRQRMLSDTFFALKEICVISNEHRQMYSDYARGIPNKGGLPKGFEEKRLDLDIRLNDIIIKNGINLPKTLLILSRRVRNIVSMCFSIPIDIYHEIHKGGRYRPLEIAEAALDIYDDYINCLCDFTKIFMENDVTDTDLQSKLHQYNIPIGAEKFTTRQGDKYLAATICVLLPEYYRLGDRLRVLEKPNNRPQEDAQKAVRH